jgi:hypothetical protein
VVFSLCAPFLMRGRACNLLVQFVVILQSKSRITRDHILLSHLRLMGSLFVASYDSQGYCGGIPTCLQSQSYLTTNVSPPVCPGVRPPSGPVINFSFSLTFSLGSCGFVVLWRPLQREGGSVIYRCCWASLAQFLSCLSLRTIFYCPNFWGSPNLEGQVPIFTSSKNWVAQLYPRALGSLFASYDTQGCGGGILNYLHTAKVPSTIHKA